MAEDQSDKTIPSQDGRIQDLDDADEVELLDLSKLESDPAAPQSVESEASAIDRMAKRRKKKEVTVDRTKLDVEACVDFAAKTKADQEERLREQLETQPPEPVKPFSPIVDFKPATPCASQWDSMTGSGRIKFCQHCKLQVYDFAKTEMPEAKETIFKQEGKENFSLFKRKDGKFLTSDCPVGVKRKQAMLALYFVGAMLLIGCAFVIASQPPPPPPTVTVEQSNTGQARLETDINRNVTSGQGWEIVSPKDKPKQPMPLPDDIPSPAPSNMDPSLSQPQSLEQPGPSGAVGNAVSPEPSSSPKSDQPATSTSSGGVSPAQPAAPGQTSSASQQSDANQASPPAAAPVAPAAESDNSQPAHETGVWQRPR